MAAVVLFACVPAASATVSVRTLGFDTLTAGSATVPLGYGAFDDGVTQFAGFDWSNGPVAVANRNDFTLNPFAIGFQNGVSSGDNVAFNFGGAGSVSIDAISGSYSFVSARFTAWFDLAAFGMPGGVQTLSLQGWSHGNLLYQDSLTLTPFAQSVVAENWSGIDRLVLNTEVNFQNQVRRPLQWMVDDFQYSVVPEADAVLQLAVGCLMLGAYWLRRHSQH